MPKYPSIRTSCPCGRVTTASSGEVHAIKKGKPLCMQWARVRVTKARGPISCARCVKLLHINAGKYEPKRRAPARRRRSTARRNPSIRVSKRPEGYYVAVSGLILHGTRQGFRDGPFTTREAARAHGERTARGLSSEAEAIRTSRHPADYD